jgi:hypothetical protein
MEFDDDQMVAVVETEMAFLGLMGLLAFILVGSVGFACVWLLSSLFSFIPFF